MFFNTFLSYPIGKGKSNLVLLPNATGLMYRLDRVPLECQLDPDGWLCKHQDIQPVVQLFPNGKKGLQAFILDGSGEYQKVLSQFKNLKKAKITSLFNQGFFSLEMAIAAMITHMKDGGKKIEVSSLDAFHCLFSSSQARSEEIRAMLGISLKTWQGIENNQLEPLAIDVPSYPLYTFLPPSEDKTNNTAQLKAVGPKQTTAKKTTKNAA